MLDPDQVNRILGESMRLRLKAIREKISLAFTFCTTVKTAVCYGQLSEAKQLLGTLCSRVRDLEAHINGSQYHVPETFWAECGEQLARLDERISRIKSQTGARSHREYPNS